MLIDSHCHLDLEQFDGDRLSVLERARATGVGAMVIPGIDLAQCRRALALAEAHADLYMAVGVHPNSSQTFNQSTVAELRAMAAHPKVVAIGEIGLDYYWHKVDPAQQLVAFRSQLALAAELGLPVIIHDRDAHTEVTATLRQWVASPATCHSRLAARPYWGVLHAFSGDLALALEAYQWNFVVSLGGPVTFKKATRLHQLVAHLRLDRLMLETDAPYLTPHPHRGQRNEPAYVALVCDQIAALLGLPTAQVAQETSSVARHVFGLEEPAFVQA
jgi:TatD DNase family protein